MGYQEAGWTKVSYKVNIFTLFLLTCLLAILGQALGDQPLNGIPLAVEKAGLKDQNDSGRIPPVRTSQSQTIQKAGEDLRQGEEGVRIGAAKLLGKYPGTTSSILLVGALDDSSALVRRASIVSLAEHSSNGYPLFDRSLLEKVFSKIADQDVEVRREVSAMIPRLVGGLMRAKMEMIEINGRKVYQSLPASLRPDLYTLALEALLDEDAIVRQNLLKYYQYLRISMPVSTFVKLLNDSDQGVLLTALSRVSSNARDSRIIGRIEELALHPSRGIRLKVVDVARDCNRYDSRYRGVLRTMTGDSDLEVASMAAVELARLGERLPSPVLEKIKSYLLNARGMTAQVTTILYAISAMGQDGVEIYRVLTDHSSSRMRTVAWQRLMGLTSGWKDPSLWLVAMKDKDKGVREAVLNNLRGRVGVLSLEQMRALVTSSYSNVRIFAGQCLMTASAESVQEFGFELLIDENEVVRSTTIRAMGVRKSPGWLKVMARSLLDDHYAVQRAAMDSLITDRKDGVPVLLEHVAKYPTNQINSLVRAELQKMGFQP